MRALLLYIFEFFCKPQDRVGLIFMFYIINLILFHTIYYCSLVIYCYFIVVLLFYVLDIILTCCMHNLDFLFKFNYFNGKVWSNFFFYY
jgi:hypothetical protein